MGWVVREGGGRTFLMMFQSAMGAPGPLCSRVRPWRVRTEAPASAQSLAYCSVLASSSKRRILHVTGMPRFLCSLWMSEYTSGKSSMRNEP